MSDISLGPGIGVFIGVVLTLAAGAVLLVIGLVVGAATRLETGERRAARVLRSCAGAGVCIAVGGLFYLTGVGGPEVLRRLDAWMFDIPVIGVSLGTTTAIAIATARRAVLPTATAATVERGAAIAVAASIAIELVVQAVAGAADLQGGPGQLRMCAGLAIGSAFVVVMAGSQALARSRRAGA